MRLEATLPFQGSYDAGLLSAVEPSCIYLANRGPFDRLRDPTTVQLPYPNRTGEHSRTVLHLSCLIAAPSTLLRDPMTLWREATLPFQGPCAGPVSAVEPSIFKQKKPDLMRVRLFTL